MARPTEGTPSDMHVLDWPSEAAHLVEALAGR